jgi:hypothetical protein
MVLDTRLTPEKRILETDLMKDEFKFKEMHFIINRYGYNPSIVKEFIEGYKIAFTYIRNLKRKSKSN